MALRVINQMGRGRGGAHRRDPSRRRGDRVHRRRSARRTRRPTCSSAATSAGTTSSAGSTRPACGGCRLSGTGVDKVAGRGLRAAAIVTCARGASAVPISEWVMAAMLAWAKRMPETLLHEPPKHWNFPKPALDSRRGQDARARRPRRHRRRGRHAGRSRSACACARCAAPTRRARSRASRSSRSLDELVAGRRPPRARRARDRPHPPSARRRRVRADEAGRAPRQHRPRRARRPGRAARRARRRHGSRWRRSTPSTPSRCPPVTGCTTHPKVRLTAHISWYTPQTPARPRSRSSSTTSGASSAASRCCTSSIRPRATERVPGAVVVGTGFGVPRARARVARRGLRRASRSSAAIASAHAAPAAERARRARTRARRSPTRSPIAGVDAVTIATPPAHARRRSRSRRARAGRHVLCEKPFALDARRGGGDAARRPSTPGSTHLVGHEFRWAPDRALVGACHRRRRDRRAPARSRSCSTCRSSPIPTRAVPEWWFDDDARRRMARRVGFAHRRPGAHVVRRDRVGQRGAADGQRARGRGRGHVRRARDDAHRASRACSSRRPRRGRRASSGMTVVAGTDGTLEVDGRRRVRARTATGRRLLDGARRPRAARAADASDDPRQRYTHLELGPYTRLCEALAARCVEGRPQRRRLPVPTFADGLAGMRVLDADPRVGRIATVRRGRRQAVATTRVP